MQFFTVIMMVSVLGSVGSTYADPLSPLQEAKKQLIATAGKISKERRANLNRDSANATIDLLPTIEHIVKSMGAWNNRCEDTSKKLHDALYYLIDNPGNVRLIEGARKAVVDFIKVLPKN